MPLTCSICKKVFSNLCNHNRHLKEVHKVVVLNDINWNSRCLESSCDSVFNTNKKLMEHLQNMHSIKFETESFPLENMNDFNNWKSEMELANNSYYVLKWRNARSTGEEVIYYKCNRSPNGYNIKETEERQRVLKSQGSCKLKSSCTSEIKIIVSNRKIVVEWQKVHYGHSIQLQHIRVPKLAKQNRLNNREKFQNTDPTVEEVDISKVLLALPKQPQLLNEKTLTIKLMAAKFESLNFKELDDETISKIHYHLTIATNLTNFPKISAVNNEFQIKNKSSKRLIKPQTRITSTKKERVETRTSLKRASVQEAKNIQENLTRTPGDSFIYKSVLPLNDHQYC